MKELTCLYEIVKLRAREDASVEEFLRAVVDLLPVAWKHTESATARITWDGRSYQSPRVSRIVRKQSASIVVGSVPRGTIEVGYTRSTPRMDEGPFLREERYLLDTVAREVGLFLDRRRAEEEAARLQDQLRHAERLATIGQLSASVAHELNGPLGSILGFAQLSAKVEGVPAQAARDIEKIVQAALHAREIVRSLLLFARQMPARRVEVDLNGLVEDGLKLVATQLSPGGIDLVCHLASDLPRLTADPSQLRQVVVNLVVNAIQAMPQGGKLLVQTLRQADAALLVVEDEGVGMDAEALNQIFLPFFTTKGVGEGTGLGLSVVHGIVTSHGGAIQVESRPGAGARFEVSLPVVPQRSDASHG
ncbi:MAG TPA: ATP-binding protein [Candidatus Polarisedimenticolaceae bacterium]|nr:ATP-binding protein [Candidatus Polarisedimenticolaceae bacterium]